MWEKTIEQHQHSKSKSERVQGETQPRDESDDLQKRFFFLRYHDKRESNLLYTVSNDGALQMGLYVFHCKEVWNGGIPFAWCPAGP